MVIEMRRKRRVGTPENIRQDTDAVLEASRTFTYQLQNMSERLTRFTDTLILLTAEKSGEDDQAPAKG